MITKNNLARFIEAQKGIYELALKEIKNGNKTGHWMWFIFPQIDGLGFSERSTFYAIKNKSEAQEYVNHDILGKRLIEISTELLNLHTGKPGEVFGQIDSLKLQSSMTLFSLLKHPNPVFQKVLDKYFDGMKDERTIQLIKENEGES